MLDGTVRVLVVEDEVKLASLIRKALREQGMLADLATKGEDALWMGAPNQQPRTASTPPPAPPDATPPTSDA
jgi:CheY-like chemotaxis protein